MVHLFRVNLGNTHFPSSSAEVWKITSSSVARLYTVIKLIEFLHTWLIRSIFFSPPNSGASPLPARPTRRRHSVSDIVIIYVRHIPGAAGSLSRLRRRSCDCNKSNLVVFVGPTGEGKKPREKVFPAFFFFCRSSFFFSLYIYM